MNKTRLSVIAAWLVAALASGLAQATPFTNGGTPPINLHWPRDSTINVYVDRVDDSNRDDLVAEGVRRWVGRMAGRGITVNVAVGPAPAGTANVVRYQFVAPGTNHFDGTVGGANGDDGRAGSTMNNQTGEISGGGAAIRNNLPTATAEDRELARNLGEHEFIHVLGLDDDPAGAVTSHDQTGAARAMNARDTAELNQVYAAAGANQVPGARAEFIGGGAALGFYDYLFTFQAGDLASAIAGEEHISWIGLDIRPQLVTGLLLPAGWIGLVPNGVVSQSDPFFTRDDYQVDSSSLLPPWDPTNPMAYIAIRSSDDEALLDGIPSGVDPGLNLGESFAIRVFTVPGAADGTVGILAGAGPLQRLTGPTAIATPSSLALVAAGMLCLLWRRRDLGTARS